MTPEHVERTVELLRQTTRVTAVRDYLRGIGVTHSFRSWDDLRDHRLPALLQSGELDQAAVLGMLESLEEHGHAHVFLYALKPNTKRPRGLRDGATPLRLDELLQTDVDVDHHVVDRRTELDGTVVVKLYRTETTQVPEGEAERDGEVVWVRQRFVHRRAVSVVAWRHTGLVEVRLASRANASDYAPELNQVRALVADVVPWQSSEPVNLANLKAKLWDPKGPLSDAITTREKAARSDQGYKIVASSTRHGANISAHMNSLRAMNEFTRGEYAYPESLTFSWNRGDDGGLPTHEIVMTLTGVSNEIVVGTHTTPESYNHALVQLLQQA